MRLLQFEADKRHTKAHLWYNTRYVPLLIFYLVINYWKFFIQNALYSLHVGKEGGAGKGEWWHTEAIELLNLAVAAGCLRSVLFFQSSPKIFFFDSKRDDGGK